MSELPSIKLKFLTATGDFDEDEYVLKSDAEAALKEKDAEITALKKRIEEMKCCGNCNQGRPDKEECAIFCKRDGSGNLDRWEARDE